MNSLPFGQLKSFLKILIGVQYKSPLQDPICAVSVDVGDIIWYNRYK